MWKRSLVSKEAIKQSERFFLLITASDLGHDDYCYSSALHRDRGDGPSVLPTSSSNDPQTAGYHHPDFHADPYRFWAVAPATAIP